MEVKNKRKPIIYSIIVVVTILLFLFASIIFIMLSAGSFLAGDLVNNIDNNDNEYELVLNREIFLQLEKHSLNERISNIPIPRILKTTIEEILVYFNIQDDFYDTSTEDQTDKVLMWDYASAVDLVEPMVIYLKSLDDKEIKSSNIGKIMEELIGLSEVEDFIVSITKVQEVTEEDIIKIIYSSLEGYDFYIPGTGGALARYEGFVDLESGGIVSNSKFYYYMYDLKRRTLNINDYYQLDQPYSTHKYPVRYHCDEPYYEGAGTIGACACGPISFAMVASYFKKTTYIGKFPNGIIEASPLLEDYYIDEVEEVVYDFCDAHPENSGSNMIAIKNDTEAMELYGVQISSIAYEKIPDGGVKPANQIMVLALWVYEEISNGHPIIFHMIGPNGKFWKDDPAARMAFEWYANPYVMFTGGGHYVVCHGYDINGDLIFTDPARPQWGKGKTYGWKQAINQAYVGYAFKSILE